MPESFYFPVFSGLLTDEHKEKIGPALWEFLWLISKTTKEIKEGEEMLGIVLGGKPIKHSDISEELGISESTVKRNIARLKTFHYIESKRTPYGEIYVVKNSKKFISKRKVKTDLSKNDRQTKNGLSVDRDRPKMTERQTENGLSNKDIKDIKDIDIKDDDMKLNPFLEYEKAFGVLSPKLIDEINYWIDESQFTDPEAIICEAIKRSEAQTPRYPAKYVNKILEDWHRMELFTLEAIKEHNEKFDRKMHGKKTNKKVSKEDFDLSDD